MTKHVFRRILLLITLYVCIIFGIFALQFTKASLFSRTIGDLQVTAAQESSSSGISQPALPLHAAVYGVDFFLDDKTSVLAYTSENNAEPLTVTAFSSDSNSFVISFTDGSSITFSPERRGDIRVLEIHASIPEKYKSIALPFKLGRSARVEKNGSLTLIRSGKETHAFSGNTFKYNESVDIQRLIIDITSPTVYYQTWLPAKGLNLESLALLPGASEEQYRTYRDRFAAAALPELRHSVVSGAVNEKIATAYIAEMGRNGMYQMGIDTIPESFKSSSSRTYLSCPFLNTLERSWQSMTALDREERSLLSRRFTENNPLVFEFPRLVPFLIDRGSAVFLDDIVRVATTIDLSRLTPLQAAGLLEVMQDMIIYSPSRAEKVQLLAETCERIIREGLLRVQDNLYVLSADGTIEAQTTLRVSQLLMRYGKSDSSNKQWYSAGVLLFTTLLSRAENYASIPAVFEVASSASSSTDPVPVAGKILPTEDAYPLVMTGSAWYPRAISLAREDSAGVWAWTASRAISVSRNPDGGVRFVVQFPRGQTHYMVMSGIKPFSKIQLYGMDFRTDPRFESYNSSGYRYNAETETLYLKMRHKEEYEDIVIYYGIPQREPEPKEADEDVSVLADREEAAASNNSDTLSGLTEQ
ncbi:MAG TPA: hypothetical protein GXZ47_06890 [Treponema sp.]|nr:hypothetical protein [Treponema sp.]